MLGVIWSKFEISSEHNNEHNHQVGERLSKRLKMKNWKKKKFEILNYPCAISKLANACLFLWPFLFFIKKGHRNEKKKFLWPFLFFGKTFQNSANDDNNFSMNLSFAIFLRIAHKNI